MAIVKKMDEGRRS